RTGKASPGSSATTKTAGTSAKSGTTKAIWPRWPRATARAWSACATVRTTRARALSPTPCGAPGRNGPAVRRPRPTKSRFLYTALTHANVHVGNRLYLPGHVDHVRRLRAGAVRQIGRAHV